MWIEFVSHAYNSGLQQSVIKKDWIVSQIETIYSVISWLWLFTELYDACLVGLNCIFHSCSSLRHSHKTQEDWTIARNTHTEWATCSIILWIQWLNCVLTLGLTSVVKKKIKAGLVSKFDTLTRAYEEPVQRLESVEHTHCSLKVQKKHKWWGKRNWVANTNRCAQTQRHEVRIMRSWWN